MNRSPSVTNIWRADLKSGRNASDEVPYFCIADDEKGRRSLDGSDAAGVAITSRTDPMKPLVMKFIAQLVAAGHAEWDMRENGGVRLRCRTGEIFLLEETTIVRVA